MTLSPSDLPYRPCVGMMIFNKEGRVFVGKRIDQTMEAWQMPQGGIDAGEAPYQACLRELDEEIGTHNVELLREHADWLTYDLPPHLIGVALHMGAIAARPKNGSPCAFSAPTARSTWPNTSRNSPIGNGLRSATCCG